MAGDSPSVRTAKLWTVVRVPAASSLKTVPKLFGPPNRGSAVKAAVGGLDHAPDGSCPIDLKGETVDRREYPSAIELEDCAAFAVLARTHRRAVEAAVRGLDHSGERVVAITVAGETMQRCQCPGPIELEDRAEVVRPPPHGRAVKAAVGGLDQAPCWLRALAAAGETMQRRQCPGPIDFVDRAEVGRAAPEGRAVKAAVRALDHSGARVGALSRGAGETMQRRQCPGPIQLEDCAFIGCAPQVVVPYKLPSAAWITPAQGNAPSVPPVKV